MITGHNIQSLVQMTAMRRADVTIDSYPEYETHLKAEQKHALQQAADVILRSYFTWSPIKAVVVVGHADKALRKPICDRTAFECTISQRRADSTRGTILREISQLTHDAHFSKALLCVAIGVGSRQLVVHNPITEKEMEKNRRVQRFFFTSRLLRKGCRV
jgi:outer membrane protein OmpA-like peptidoglycan-associated protein